MSITRAEVVDHLVMLATNKLKGSLDLVEEVYGYIPANPQGISPIFAVVGASTNRISKRETQYGLFVYWFVLAADKDLSISEQDAWTALNAIGEAFFDLLETNRFAEGYWTSIVQNEPTSVDTFAIENHGYLVEVCPLTVKAY